MRFKQCFVLFFSLLTTMVSLGQGNIDDIEEYDYSEVKSYTIGGVEVVGVKFLSENVIVMLSGLVTGDKIEVPGEKFRNAVKKLWKQGLFDDIKITTTRIDGDVIYLAIHLRELPRLSRFSFDGIKKGEADDLRDELKIVRGDVVTKNLVVRSENTIRKFFRNKGYLNARVNIGQTEDTSSVNYVTLRFDIEKGNKVKVRNIVFKGNQELTDALLKRSFKETKEKGHLNPFDHLWPATVSAVKSLSKLDLNEAFEAYREAFNKDFKFRIFKASRLIEEDYKTDKEALIARYNEEGFRDATVLGDSVIINEDNTVDLHIKINEGHRYYFRNITWVGNTKYGEDQLNSILKITNGDVYNQRVMETNLSYNPNGYDVSSLYLDDGYLFFQVVPVEIQVENDSIDIEMRIHEGKQAIINEVRVKGNTRTNDHVVMREIRTKPGQLFNRSDIIRTTRELAQLRYFNQEKIVPDVQPNPADGTVDIEYSVEETSADQVELSGGWGYGRVIGTVGLSFNNFSAKNLLKRKAWAPIPAGDGQKLSLRLQSYGKEYISYSASFTEPWLGGKKPNAFSVSYYHSRYMRSSREKDGLFRINGISFSLGKRLQWPDDYFTLYQTIGLQQYDLDNYGQIFSFGDGNGTYNNYSYTLAFGRNSVNQPIFPRNGSDISLAVELTPPYSWFSNEDYKTMDDEKKFKWIEYHKWKFNFTFYKALVGDLVLQTRTKWGFLGMYNSDIGVTPFERFYLGGDGLSGYSNLDGREIVGFRGYANESLTPESYKSNPDGGTIYSKNTLELRYPLSLNPSATIYVLSFLEAGNAWNGVDNFKPFNMMRSAGVGVRIFLPMFGLLGLDWGYGFDDVYGVPSANKGQFHFSINSSID